MTRTKSKPAVTQEPAAPPATVPQPPALAGMWFGFIAGTAVTPEQATRLAHGVAALVTAGNSTEAAFERLAVRVGLPELTAPQRRLFLALFAYAVETGGDL